MSRGYPTPDEFELEFVGRCVYVPNNPVFIALIGGLLFQATKEYFWVQQGTMPAETAAYYMAKALALYDAEGLCDNSMTCEQIIECIETDADVQAAFSQWLSENGYSQGANGTTPPVPLLPARTSENLLPADYTCDNDHLFGMARFIVQNLHESSLQLIQSLELITNNAELVSVFVDNVEATSWAGSALELVAWLQDQLIEYYEGSWSTGVDDALVCAIFCALKDNCEVTLDILLSAYSENIISTPPNTEDWLEILSWLTGLSFSASIGTVATFHYFCLQALRFGSNALNFVTGLRSLALIIQLAANDTDADWETLCEDCPEPVDGFDPVISLAPCNNIAGQTAGTVDSQQSTDVWRISSTHRAEGNDECISLADSQGRLFRVTAVTLVSGTAVFSWSISNNACGIQSGFTNDFLNVDAKNLLLAGLNGNVYTLDVTVVIA